MNTDLLKEVAKTMPIFGEAGKAKQSHIMWDVPASQLTNSIQSFASNEVHRPLLAQAAYAYKDATYIADVVAPFYGVRDLHGEYRKFAERTFYDRPETATAKDTPPARIEYSSTRENWDLTGRALSIYLSNVDRSQAITQYGSEAAWRNVAVMMLTRLLLLDREVTVKTLYQTNGNYASGFYTTASPLWSDAAATLLSDCATAEDTLLTSRDLYVMSNNVWRICQRHPAITGATSITSAKRAQTYPYVDLVGLENYFDSKIIVGKGRYNSSPEANTFTASYIWADYLSIVHVMPDPGGPELSAPFVRTFVLEGDAIPNYKGFAVKSVKEENTLAGGEVLMVGYFAQEKVFAQKSGYNLKCL